MEQRYDIIVVGAGPAGSIFCRQAPGNLRILRIDGSGAADGHRKKPCGGLLAPQAAQALAALGLTLPKAVLTDPQIFAVRTMDIETGREQTYPRNYVNMDRDAFDGWLKSLAADNVTDVYGRVSGVQKAEDGWRVTYTDGAGEKKTAAAKYIVGADGAGGMIRRAVYPKRRVYSYTALQRWYPLQGEPLYACVFHRPSSPSCSWLFAKDGKLAFGGAFVRKGCRQAFLQQERILKEKYGFAMEQVLTEEACVVYRPRYGRDIYGGRDGCWLIGEAAGLISPSSFEGISYAIRSGAALAESIARTDCDKITRAYTKAIKPLKREVLARRLKRPFMYNKALRNLVLKSGLQAMTAKKS